MSGHMYVRRLLKRDIVQARGHTLAPFDTICLVCLYIIDRWHIDFYWKVGNISWWDLEACQRSRQMLSDSINYTYGKYRPWRINWKVRCLSWLALIVDWQCCHSLTSGYQASISHAQHRQLPARHPTHDPTTPRNTHHCQIMTTCGVLRSPALIAN